MRDSVLVDNERCQLVLPPWRFLAPSAEAEQRKTTTHTTGECHVPGHGTSITRKLQNEERCSDAIRNRMRPWCKLESWSHHYVGGQKSDT